MASKQLANSVEKDIALELRYIMYITRWETDEKNIDINMYTENYETKLNIHYEDKSYEGEGYQEDTSGL